MDMNPRLYERISALEDYQAAESLRLGKWAQVEALARRNSEQQQMESYNKGSRKRDSSSPSQHPIPQQLDAFQSVGRTISSS